MGIQDPGSGSALNADSHHWIRAGRMDGDDITRHGMTFNPQNWHHKKTIHHYSYLKIINTFSINTFSSLVTFITVYDVVFFSLCNFKGTDFNSGGLSMSWQKTNLVCDYPSMRFVSENI